MFSPMSWAVGADLKGSQVMGHVQEEPFRKHSLRCKVEVTSHTLWVATKDAVIIMEDMDVVIKGDMVAVMQENESCDLTGLGQSIYLTS